MNAIAIIPARGGSKRIPRKNIRLFCGKPMIAHPIAAARESGLFDRIPVSTEDAEVGSDAKVGAREPIRGDDCDKFLPGYRLRAANIEPFGLKTVDGFHSELRGYERTPAQPGKSGERLR